MSLSVCVCVSGVILFSMENSKQLKQDEGFARVSVCSFMSVSRECQGCLSSVSRKLKGNFTDVLRKCSSKIEGHFK